MELKHAVALIHISAEHLSREAREKAIADYLKCQPDIDKNEVKEMIPETPVDE